ncbi:MAG: hypothetical protein AAF416_09820 [Pseudomonadota bacterium]
MNKPPLPSFEEAMALLNHAEEEIRRGEGQAQTFMGVNALAAGAAIVAGGASAVATPLLVSAIIGLAIGCGVMLQGHGGGRQMKDARQALYLDAIGERETYAEFVRSFTLLSATPAERVLHAVYLRSIWAKRKQRLVRLLGVVTVLNLLLTALAVPALTG